LKILVAESAGFCFGVSKAVDAVNRLLDEGQKVCTLGPIIHNPQVVERLKNRGVKIIDSPEQAPEGSVVVIRSHGVPRDVYQQMEGLNVRFCDATCPFVAKIHKIVARESEAGAVVIIAGNEGHPEVVGIRGHCSGPSFVASAPEDISDLHQKGIVRPDARVALVAQTTFNTITWKKCAEIAKKLYTNVIIFDTICYATAERQNEAVNIAKKSDIMVIVGGRESSNTAKLRDVCSNYCRTILIENADELDPSIFKGVRTVGVTAGASTPTDIIKEVLSTMSEMVKEEKEFNEAQISAGADEGKRDDVASSGDSAHEKSFDEMSFEEALEASLQNMNNNERVRGVVVGIAPNEVQVEVVGRKQTGYIPVSELSFDPDVNPADVVKIGDELELLVLRTNDQEGTIMLSKKRVDAVKGWQKIVEAEEKGEILEGVVTDVVKGGIIAVAHGVRVFIPASQASHSRVDDLNTLLKQKVRFKILETNKSRRRAVGSVKAVAREERKQKVEAFWASAEVGKQYTGVVKSLTSYGAFVDLGGVDGMIHISELSWNRIKHPSEVVKVGDTVKVYIRDLDREKNRISLGYKKTEDNPWEVFKANYPVGTVCKAKIVGLTTFGAFAEIIPGVDGLIHISQIANRRIEKPEDELKVGQEVTVKITNIDYDNKRISLSIRALIEEAEKAKEQEEKKEEPAEDNPVVMSVGPEEEKETKVESDVSEADTPEVSEPDTPEVSEPDTPEVSEPEQSEAPEPEVSVPAETPADVPEVQPSEVVPPTEG